MKMILVWCAAGLLCLNAAADRIRLTVADSERRLVSCVPGRQTLRVKVEADVYDFTVRAKFAPYGKAAPRFWSDGGCEGTRIL